MEAGSTDVYSSLDMLAEVASEKYRSLSVKVSPEKKRINPKNNINAPRKSVSSSEKLTLEQIKSLSDKMLIEMFSELSCDEIRKNYSFQCFLIPDKCSQIFKSFGNEARARCKMKMHLQCHIKDLTLEANESTDKSSLFTAEPLHVRRKRLKDLNSKSVRKRRKSKQSGPKTKKHSSTEASYKVMNQSKVKSLKSVHSIASKTMQSVNSRSESFSRRNFNEIVEPIHTGQELSMDYRNGDKNNGTNSYNGRNLDSSCVQNISEKKLKRKKVHSSSVHSDFVVKWDTDFDNTSIDDSTVFDFDASYYSPNSYLPSDHDHAYTSILGKTFTSESENNKSNRRIPKTKKKSSHHFVDRALVLPSLPFPFVYIPLLPHASEVKEIHTTPKVISYKRSRDTSQCILKRKSKLNQEFFSLTEKDLRLVDGLEKIEEDEQDSESTLSDSFLFDDHQINDEPSDEITKDICSDKMAFNMDDLKTDCPPSLQSIEKKLALKYIRALRTKKKEERGPLVCQICKNKSFTAQATLLYHYRSHAGIKPFSCTVCEATFTRQHSLKYHMLIHYNKSRFVCSDCGRSFRHPSHFKEHLRRHTGETPYECTDCNLRFKTRNTYKRHLKTRHGKILTMSGIHHLSDGEFCKISSSPRKKEPQTSVSNTDKLGMPWWDIVFPDGDMSS